MTVTQRLAELEEAFASHAPASLFAYAYNRRKEEADRIAAIDAQREAKRIKGKEARDAARVSDCPKR